MGLTLSQNQASYLSSIPLFFTTFTPRNQLYYLSKPNFQSCTALCLVSLSKRNAADVIGLLRPWTLKTWMFHLFTKCPKLIARMFSLIWILFLPIVGVKLAGEEWLQRIHSHILDCSWYIFGFLSKNRSLWTPWNLSHLFWSLKFQKISFPLFSTKNKKIKLVVLFFWVF